MAHRDSTLHAWQCTALPLWVRVSLYAQHRHGVRHCPGELRLVLGITDPNDLSRAIRRGIRAGLLAHDSTARNLYTLLNRGDQS